MEMRAGGSGPTAVAQNNIRSTTPIRKTDRLLNTHICGVEPGIIRAVSSTVIGAGLNCEPTFEQAGIGRIQLNVACSVVSKFQPMRLSILALCVALSTSFAAQPEVVPMPTVPAAVVEGADKIDVKLRDGRNFSGRVVGTDEKTDIAVVKIDAKDLPVVQLGDSDAVRVGQFAFAIGAPFKLDYTFTYGVVSGKGRSKLLQTGAYSISDYLQTDASINPGNSGGPLCDIDGKVIGMNTLINGMNRGLGFAIPVN